MVLFYAAAFLLLAFFSAIFLGRFFAKVVEVIARCFLKLDLTIETFGFLSVIGIKIKLKNNNIIEIEFISLKTKWTHSNSRKLFTIYFGKTLISQEGSTGKESKPNVKKKGPNNFINSHKERISQFINLFCQYIAISFSEVGVILRQSDNRLIQCKLQDGLDISANPTGKCLNAVILMNKVATELNCVSDKSPNSYENVAEISVEVAIEASIQPLEGISSADIQLSLRSLCMILNDGLLKKYKQPVAEPSLSHLAEAENRMLSRGEDSEQLATTKLWSSLAKVPKHVELSIDNSSINFINKDKRSLIVDITRIISSFAREGNLNETNEQCDINLVISGISVSGLQSCKLCTMNRFRFQAKLCEEDSIPQLATSISIESFHNSYIHDDYMYWMEYFRSQMGQRHLAKTDVSQTKSSKRSLPFNISTKLDLELIDCSTCFYLTHKEGEQPLCRAVLASFTTILKIPSQDLGETNLGIQEISIVSRMENAYVYFDELKTVPTESLDNPEAVSYTLLDDPALLPNTNSHLWGRMLAMGSCSIQCEVSLPREDDNSLLVNIRGEANGLALEWSHQVCITILQITKQFTQGLITVKDKGEHRKPTQKTKVSLDTEFRLGGINIFYLGTCVDGVDSFVYRTDMVLSTFSSGRPVLLDIFGIKVSRMLGLKKEPYRCLLSKELNNQCVSVPAITMSLANDKVISLSLQDTTVDWNPTLHMALYDRLQEVTQDVMSMKEVFITSRQEGQDSIPQVDHDQEKPTENTQEARKGFNLKCDISSFKLQMETSPSTSFGVELRKSSLELQNRDVTVAMDTAVMLFDEKNTFTFKGISIQRTQEVEIIRNLRKMFANLQTLNNTTWVIAVQSTTVLFPYQFDFASSRSELVNVAKMLKALHKKPRDTLYVEPLPPDLWLRFEEITLEIEDDPFEVKLGDNYVLLQEEAKQWSDRKKTLENRLQAIRMTPGNLLTVKKEKMLFQKLLEKNAELYIQRSKALYSQNPMRRNLLVWDFESLDLKILADESYHGKVKAVEMMTKLNSESTPPSEQEFSTLWCRTIKGTLDSHCCRLRDYPRPIFTSKEVKLCGTFLGAEQSAEHRAKYSSSIIIEEPWGDMTVQRSLTALKFFYDLDFDMDTLELAWGVDIDPAIAMVSLAFENLSKPSKDPSKPLPFYDKIRLLLHGRLHMDIKKWLMFFSATRNPYNTTERLELDWMNVDLLWTNGRIEIAGDFTLQTRTASRYDDREVLHFPAFKVCSDMEWNCSGDANDHHSIMPFAPSKLPELAPNKAHDSYALFRSQSLTLHLSLETAMDPTKNLSQLGSPYVCLYASTLRWFNNYQEVVLRNSSRPIKRGRYFNRIAVKKQTLGRHYKEVSLSLKFPKLSAWYWGSFSQQRGFEMTTESGSLHTQYRLALRPFEGGLSRRPAADWTATKLHIEIREITCHLYGLDPTEDLEDEEQPEVSSIDLEPIKYYFLTTESLEYSRQDASKQQPKVDESEPDSQSYVHQLVCHGSKGVWTLTNRKIIFGLFEAYTNAEVLKKNLSADALKITIVDKKQQKPQTESPGVTLPKNRSMSLLQKLVNEKDSKFTVFTEEGTGTVEPAETPLQGVSLCTSNDFIAHTWHIKLVNTQILLQGTETKGGVLVTAGNSTVLNRLHRPVWSKTELLNKKTWVGTVENLQYFATVSPDDCINLNNIPWLDTTVITGRQSQEKTGFDIADLANIVGSGEAVGGVVTSVVGGTTAGAAQDIPQLQRIVARCGCEFYFVNFSTELDPLAEGAAPNSVPQSPASRNHLRVNRLPTVDTYTVRHKLLEISTNSSQYLMLIDIVNNVVFYTEPKKKEANERLQKMTFRLQLSASEDQRAQILKQQNIVRHRQTEMRGLQRQLYELNLVRKQALDNIGLTEAMIQLEREITQKKELLNSASTELKLLISAYKDFQMNLNPPTPEKAPTAEPTKLAEVHFNHASWKLNQADGQLEIADATFRNFSYSKTTLSDATIEHRFEVPKFNVRNLLPNSIYKDVLTQRVVSGQGPKDRAVMVRLYCRVKPPVGGIGVKEHLEVNVCPLSVGLTYRLFRKVMTFFFPQREHEYDGDAGEVDLIYRGVEQELDKDFEDGDLFVDDLEDNFGAKSSNLKRCPSTASSISSSSDASVDSASTKSRKSMTSLVSYTDAGPSSSQAKDKGKKKSTFYRPLDDHDDLEKMKERASKNHSFIYVKVTEVLLCVSYKGEKEKNIVDVRNFNLTLPTLEYHNRTWTWHDLLIAMKKDCINVLVSQIIKEKLHLKGRRDGDGTESKDSKSETKEEDKAKLLFGDRSKTEKKKSKKSFLGKLVKKTRLSSKPSGLLQPDGAAPEPVNLEGEEYEQNEEEAPDSSDNSSTDTKL